MSDNLNDWLKGHNHAPVVRRVKTPQERAVDYALRRIGVAILVVVGVYLIVSNTNL